MWYATSLLNALAKMKANRISVRFVHNSIHVLQQSAHRCVVAVFESRASVHYSSPLILFLTLPVCTIPQPTSVEAISPLIYPGQTPAPLDLPFGLWPSTVFLLLFPPLPFTRYKNTLTVGLSVLLYSRLKRPIIPPTERML